jgi:stage V sporulation protein G
MEITEVHLYLAEEEYVMAYASIVLDEVFIVRDLKVIEMGERLVVAMPSRKMKDGAHRDTAHPLNRETRRKIDTKVLEAYEEARKAQERGLPVRPASGAFRTQHPRRLVQLVARNISPGQEIAERERGDRQRESGR